MTSRSTTARRDPSDPLLRPADTTAPRLLARARWRRLVVLGGNSPEPDAPRTGDGVAGWPDQVAAALRTVRPDLAYLNLAQPGRSLPDIRARQLAGALAFRGDLVVLDCGRADVLRASFDPDVVEAELSRLVAALRDRGIAVLTVGPFDLSRSAQVPPHHRAALRARLTLLSDRARAVALRHGAGHVDLVTHPANAEPGGWGRGDLAGTPRGRAVTATAVIRALAGHLGDPG